MWGSNAQPWDSFLLDLLTWGAHFWISHPEVIPEASSDWQTWVMCSTLKMGTEPHSHHLDENGVGREFFSENHTYNLKERSTNWMRQKANVYQRKIVSSIFTKTFWGTERVNKLSKVTQLMSSKIYTHFIIWLKINEEKITGKKNSCPTIIQLLRVNEFFLSRWICCTFLMLSNLSLL